MASVNIKINNQNIFDVPVSCTVSEINTKLLAKLGLNQSEFYLLQNGKSLLITENINTTSDIHVALRMIGGKGGFGSMLRAIGAQIEKTTNREACRDLSGRRLRDINEEKRLKAWLDGQKDREQEAEEKRKKRIEKLQAKPKHEFKDEVYEKSRLNLTQNISDSVEEGFRRAAAVAASATLSSSSSSSAAAATATSTSSTVNSADGILTGKRKIDEDNNGTVNQKKNKIQQKKKKKTNRANLWLGSDDLSSSSDTDSDSEADSSSGKSTENGDNKIIKKLDDTAEIIKNIDDDSSVEK